MSATNSVPHHRVTASLHARARQKASTEHVSLSAVATAGLAAFSASADAIAIQRAAVGISRGRLARQTPVLPDEAAQDLLRLSLANDPQLHDFLWALHEAGWSYGALAAPLRMSRQAIHARLAKHDPCSPTEALTLPPVPPGPSRAGAASDELAERFDWAIWVDRAGYAIAAQHAVRSGIAMHDVMENILTQYLDGSLVVALADKADSTMDNTRKVSAA